MTLTVETRGVAAAPLRKVKNAERRTWRTRSKAETEGAQSCAVRAAVAELWPGGVPAWLTRQRRNEAIRNWAFENRAPRPSDRTIRRYLRERA